MQRVGTMEEVVQKRETGDRKIYIIGAGKDGKTACRTLLDKGVEVSGFIDEDKRKRGLSYYGVPVYQPDDIKVSDIGLGIICIGAFAYLDDEDILGHRVLNGIPSENLLLLDRGISIWKVLRAELESRQIDMDASILDICGMRLPNYLKMNRNVRQTFLTESCDLILPYFFHNQSVMDEGPYEDGTFGLSNFTGGVIVDCGANLGLFAARAAMNPSNHVYAFEPVVKSLHYLWQVAALYPNIRVCEKAITDHVGTVEMSCTDILGQNKMLEAGDGIEVNCTSIDAFVEERGLERVDFIKADIEGAERYMLRGARNTLERYAPKLSICEYHLDDDPEVLERLILEANSDYLVQHRYRKIYAYVPQ